MYRYKNLIIKRIAVLLAVILFKESSIVINTERIFADNYEDSLVEMDLISNTNQNNTISLCKIEDAYYISIPDLCDCTRATYDIENNKCYVSQGMWSVEFDYDKQIFDDSTQKIDTTIYFIADKYWIPAVEFINYFGGSLLIDEIKNTVKCEMPNITAWEALNIDYENTIFNLYDAYGGKGATILSFALAYITEGLLGNIKGSNGHIKGVYNEALKIDPIEYNAVQSYVSNIEQANSEYFEGNYSDSIPETIKNIDNSEQTLMVVCELIYGIQSSKLMQLCKAASDSGDNLESYNYAADILEAYRKKEKIVNAIQTVNYATKAVSLLAGSAIATANEIKLNESSDRLVYKVLGKENYERLGIDTSNNIWVSAANTYKSGWGLFGSNFLTESLGLATDAMIEGGLNKLAEGAMGAGAVGLIAGRKLMKKCPWTSSGVEGFHSEYCGIMLAQLQKELINVLKKTYDETDFTNKEDLKQLIDTMNMYCRATIAMCEYLKVAQKEFGSNHDYWQSKFDDIRDKAALSLYLMAPFMNEGAVKVIPISLQNLRRVIAENEDVWLIRNLEEDSPSNKQDPTDKAVISELYSKAIADYDKMMLEREQFFNENWPEGYHSNRKTYYSIVDIDNNGIDELILRFDNPNQEHLTNIDSGYGETTFVYTVTAGELTLVIAPEYEGYNPEFAHNSFIRIYKGSNLINNGIQHVPGDHIFFRYQEGKLSPEPVIEITMGGVDPGTWLLNHKEVSREKCEETYNNAVNGDEGYELQLYEALGDEQEADVSTEKGEKTFMGISPLNKGEEKIIVANGSTYQIRYDSTEESDEYVGINLYLNNTAEIYYLDAVYFPSIENVYVTDIDIGDSYCNIVVVIGGEDDKSSTYLFAFSDSEIRLISEFIGRLVPESVSGDGTILLEYGIGMGIRDYGSFRIRPEISVHDLYAEQVKLHSGRRVYSEAGSTYEEEFKVPLYSDLTVYGEPSCTTVAGVIPAGNSVLCEYAEYVRLYGSFYVTGEEVSGYATSSMLRSSCDDIFFVG